MDRTSTYRQLSVLVYPQRDRAGVRWAVTAKSVNSGRAEARLIAQGMCAEAETLDTVYDCLRAVAAGILDASERMR